MKYRFALSLVLWLLAGPQAFAFGLELQAASEPRFAHPHDIVLSPDGRHLYVADNGNHRIAVLDALSLDLLRTFGEDEVREPHDVVFQSADRLLVADTGNSRIAVYRIDNGEPTLEGALRGAIRRPEGVAVHPNGRIYVTGAASGNIEAFENGRSLASADGLSAPHDVAVDRHGHVWVADAGNDRMVGMKPDLSIVRVLQGAPYDFNGPRYMDFDGQGRLYVADKYNHHVKVIGGDGRMLLTLGSGEARLGAGEFDRPEGVVLP